MSLPVAIYGTTDPRDVPAYRVPELARYLALPASTVRAWTFGQLNFRPVLKAADADLGLLSFKNLVEAHVLSALRVHHKISMPKIRRAIRYLSRTMESKRPLFELPLMTGGGDLFVEAYGSDLVTVSQEGQLAMRDVIAAYLLRVEKDDSGVIRLFPFTRKGTITGQRELQAHPKLVVIDPRVSFGRPVIAGTNIRTSVVAERYLAGESIANLAQDYRRSPDEIEEAIRCETPAAA